MGFFFLQNILNETNCWNFCRHHLDEGHGAKKLSALKSFGADCFHEI